MTAIDQSDLLRENSEGDHIRIQTSIKIDPDFTKSYRDQI